MIASLLNKTSRIAIAFSVVGMMAASSVLAQDEAEEKKPQETPAVETAEPKTQNRFFLGGRPALKRQVGPSIGKPKSILPQPFVPKGSVKVPPAPALSSDIAEGEKLALVNAEQQETQQGELPQVQDLQDASLPADDFSEASLALFDPSGMDASGEAGNGFSADFWQGYDRASYKERLKDFENAAGSPALVSIANKLVLSAVPVDPVEDEAVIVEFISARLDLLQKLGNAEGYSALLAALPAGRDWTALARYFTNAYLVKGNVADACILASQQRETDNDAYWLRMTAFCKAIEGNRTAVDFELGILEEVSQVQPTFYQLIDKILVEAELQSSGGVSTKVDLTAPLQVDLLEASMARLAGVGVPELALENVNPLAVAAILSNPNVAGAVKADLMGLAVREGWATGDVYAQFARAYQLTPDEVEAANQLAVDDPRFSIDAVLGNQAGNIKNPEERANALKLAWERSVRQKYASVAGGGLVALSTDTAPNAGNIETVGILARAALVSGDLDAANGWYRAVRAQSAGANDAADMLLVELAPLVALLTSDDFNAGFLEGWWQALEADEKRFEKANLMFTLVEALGHTVPENMWTRLEEGPAVYGGQTPSPALWRKFLITANGGDKPKTLALAYRLLSEGGPAGVPAALAGSLVGNLVALGLNDEARLIATEMLISQGI
ncbi:hypothetical protein [Kordiimonas laminariae]|uniref:hypothetical protein n=1 Tax=Kordiimonas laminariae TaxID=2917717 RepID=UPI001FF24E86|nr:hypothetical protein [Kordiimonas laminariae]MCK0071194.1 hypothetical protein [Kordiimonas laminariae]